MQPVQQSIAYTGAATTYTATAKGHITAFLAYNVGNWGFNLQNEWYSDYPKSVIGNQVYVEPLVPQRDYVDISVDRKFTVDDNMLDLYFSIQNALDQGAPIVPTNQVSPGLYYLGIQGTNTVYDAIGRYFTIGIRAQL
jgi:hypothetical protein